MLIDTHAHIYLEQFENDFAQVEQNAIDAGVECILLPNIDETSILGVKNLMSKNPSRFKGMMGLHPCSVGLNFEEQLHVIEKELRSGNYIAIGEIGIDMYWEKALLKQQQDAFRIQIEWAKDLGLPIAIHARDSFNEIFEILDEVNDDSLTGVFHCFTGDREQANHILDYGGFKLGIGGVFTFKNSGLRDTLTGINLEQIILETDAPYLAPAPHRGKRNEPAYTRIVAQKWSDTYGVPIEEVEQITTQNAKKLFNI